MQKLTPDGILALPSEGERAIEALARLCEQLGYKGGQLLLRNGAAVTSITTFLEDNPGAVGALYEWIVDNAGCWPGAIEEDSSNEEGPTVGEQVYFDEHPEGAPDFGEIIEVNGDEVIVGVGDQQIHFETNGSSWSSHGSYKREPWGWTPEELLTKEEKYLVRKSFYEFSGGYPACSASEEVVAYIDYNLSAATGGKKKQATEEYMEEWANQDPPPKAPIPPSVTQYDDICGWRRGWDMAAVLDWPAATPPADESSAFCDGFKAYQKKSDGPSLGEVREALKGTRPQDGRDER